jgi:hypothetical protein
MNDMVEVQGAMPVAGNNAPESSGVKRDPDPALAEQRKLVAKWQKEILADKKYYKDQVARMRRNMRIALYGAEKEWVDAGSYTVPIINRHINQSVAALYAKNPKAVAKRKPRLNFKLWDGASATANEAVQGAMMNDPMSMQIVTELQEAKSRNTLMSRMGRTLEILFEYYAGENTPNFKQQMKSHVRRSKTCGVSYIEVSFQRALEPDPDITSKIDDMTQQIAAVESRIADAVDGVIDEGSVEYEEMKVALQALQEQEMILVREGVTFDFPRSTEVIPHRACRQLRGFIGSDYITREFHMTPDEIQATYKVDVRKNYLSHTAPQGADVLGNDKGESQNRQTLGDAAGGTDRPEGKACVWRVQDKKNRQVFTIVEGYPDFVKAPEAHPVQVEGFWTIYPLTFNDVEDEKEVFPLSDVEYLTHPQREFNNVRQGLREHRRANRPKYFTRAGTLETAEKEKLQNHEAHAVIEVKGMDSDTPLDALITGFKSVPIDPSLYETRSIIGDVLYGVGSQEANLGPTSGATATESSISEQSRMSTIASNVDDLDEHLSDVAKACGQIMLAELSEETVVEIVGPGAVWPQLDREQIAKEIMLDIKAGSSGRPNKAAELANMERGMPYLLQLGSVSPTVLAERYADLLDLDTEELIVDGTPSIVAMNAMAAKEGQGGGQVQPGTGDPATDPAQQGASGQDNAAAPGQSMNNNEGGPQPEYPAPKVLTYDSTGRRTS